MTNNKAGVNSHIKHRDHRGIHSKDLLTEDFETIKQKIHEASDAFTQAAKDLKDKAGDLLTESMQEAKDRTLDMQKTAVTYVKANPFKSIGVGILAGLIIGFIARK